MIGSRAAEVGLRRALGFALAFALALPCCTTFMQPMACTATEEACAELHDVKFCEGVVVAATGSDCAAAGLIPGKPFCYVATVRCVRTIYALRDRDCVVREYTPVRDGYECSPGAPTFGPPSGSCARGD